MAPAPVRKIHFGSSQERKMLPMCYPPNRLGNQFVRESVPRLGPGCYENHQLATIVYDLEKTPMSKKGYGLSARTAERFSSIKSVAPSPQQYQPDQSASSAISPGKTPFNSSVQRFSKTAHRGEKEEGPGPGRYNPFDVEINRKVSWPMCFGSPDWSSVPQPEKKLLRGKSNTEKEFLKRRNRVAYLSLYY